MRKIAHPTAHHNIAAGSGWLRTTSLIPLCLVLLAVLSGCGSGQNEGAGGRNEAGQDCPGTVNSAGWTEFTALSERLAQGTDVPRSELEAYAELPVVAAWRRSQQPNEPSVGNLANWLEGTWWEELGRQGRRKPNADGVNMARTYRYSHEHRAAIDALVAGYTSGDQLCKVREILDAWVTPANIPAPLVVNFIPALAEIRTFEDQVFVDTSVLQAGGPDQVVRQIATLVYRNREAVSGLNPIEAEGAAAVAECFRVFMNEGVAGWIEQTTNVHFDAKHPTLGRVRIVPEDFFRKTQETIADLEAQLPHMLVDADLMASNGKRLARMLAAKNAFSQTGIGMATAIVGQHGVERLQAVRLSVPDFFAAYQEAALQNPSPAPRPGTLGIELADSVPPLRPEVYEQLLVLLEDYFGGK